MSKIYTILLIAVLLLESCELRLKPFDIVEGEKKEIAICRYDRLESQYLTTSDFSALQQMNTDYPIETRTLIEDMLKLGEVDDPEINKKFLTFYQDSTLQTIISDAESKYANVDDLNKTFNTAFKKLKEMLPDMPMPMIYTQIGALDQSIVIGNEKIGISLDKYLGESYPLYKKFYPLEQRKSMNRRNIVPDALCFYLMSLYPIHDFEKRTQLERDLHIAKLMWLCNKALDKNAFNSKYTKIIDCYVKHKKSMAIDSLMRSDDYTDIREYLYQCK